MKSILYLLFSPRGRINRKQWWLGVSICAFPAMYFWEWYMMHLKLWQSGNRLWIPIVLVLVICLWMFFAVSLKRHQDRNRPEGRTVFLAIFGIPLWMLGLIPDSPLVGIQGLVTILWIIFFGCPIGNTGENRYGPPPKPLFKFKKESA